MTALIIAVVGVAILAGAILCIRQRAVMELADWQYGLKRRR